MNSFAPLDPALIDVGPAASEMIDGHCGYVDDGGDTPDAMRDCCGAAARDFPKELWIEPKDWADKARDNDKYHTWPINFIDRYTNQNPSHECVYHSLTRGMEAARNRHRGIIFPEGPKKNFRYEESAKFGVVWLSPMSGYGIVNPGRWGGANVRQSLEVACKTGLLPDKIQPRAYGFQHTLTGTSGQGNNNQSGGEWIPESRFPEGCKETSKHFRVLEAIFPEIWEQVICLILAGMFEHCGRDGHAIPRGQLMFEGDNLKAIAYPDSYDVTRYDSLAKLKSSWRGSFAIASVTVPDDWNKPAGN
jgi:hypothetical protein